jgi:preprotein translocase subunit SecD
MKTVIYSLLAIFLFGIFATAVIGKQNKYNSIILESVDKSASPELLNLSANIISNRLKAYSSNKFEININKEQKSIQISIANTWDIKTAASLITQKGKLEFYEVYSSKEVADILKNNATLLGLLKDKAKNDVSPILGCASNENVSKINAEIKSLQLNKTCKFAWSSYGKNSICLYALKVQDGKVDLLGSSDIESVKAVNNARKENELEIKFKNSAKKQWAEITKRNIGKSIAMVLDDNVLSAPIVRDEITGGNAQITGDYSMNEVNFIASILSNGELPLDFNIVK